MKNRFQLVSRLKFQIILVLVSLIGFSNTTYAATVHVEVIVFANNSMAATDLELFETAEEVIRTEAINEHHDPLTLNFDNVPVAAKRLNRFAQALEAHSDYEILNFLSWTQEPVPRSRTTPVSLEVEYPHLAVSSQKLLDGEVALFEVQQQLQFEVNAFYKPEPDTIQDSIDLAQSIILYSSKITYQLNERRRVYINDIHYFDHPKFGVIFSIVRPPPVEETTTETPLSQE